MSDKPVFYDPEGSRRRIFSVGSIVAIAIASVIAVIFAISVVVVPAYPLAGSEKRPHKPLVASPQDRLNDQAAVLLAKDRAKLASHRSGKPSKAPPYSGPGDPICAAFYAPWQENGVYSLRTHAANLTHLIPQWVHLTNDKALDFTTDFDPQVTPRNLEVMDLAAKNGIKVFPILDNGYAGTFDAKRAQAFLSDDEAQQKAALQIKNWLVDHDFKGINVDFEEIGDEGQLKLVKFLNLLKQTFEGTRLRVTVDIETSTSPAVMQKLATAADWVVLMCYDEHSEDGKPGPIASLNWSQKCIDDALEVIPPQKLVVGMGNYAYDWEKGKPNAKSLTYQEAMTLAADNREEDKPEDVVDMEPESVNPSFEYVDDSNKERVVWILDGITAFNQYRLARRAKVRGGALWALGSEDPTVWSFYSRNIPDEAASPEGLRIIDFKGEIDYDGEGEILSVKSRAKPGERTFVLDAETDLVVDQAYRRFPSPDLIQRSGLKPKKLALTFDDGPDRTYTPQVLDALKEANVPGTFFVVGSNAEKEPALLRRIVDEGHEVGSHSFTHPNLGTESEQVIQLELNATQRAIQSTTGRSTTLFRPPYFADAEPSSSVEVIPVTVAAALGYVTVGELIDPEDWLLQTKDADGNPYHRTVQDIVDKVVTDARKGIGCMILLHDAGGDRSATVKAIPMIVKTLRAEGYEFVTVSNLMGKTRDQVMPPVSAKDMFAVGVDRVAFYAVYGLEALLALCFVIAIGMGVARSVLMTPLAWVYEARRRKEVFEPTEELPSVLIAAYNEEKVIVRTIKSLLANDYPVREIIVVDDGSKDGTGEVVREAFGDHPLIRLIQQENCGKAAALNRAIEEASGGVLVCVDADTQFSSNCIRLLMRHFDDPEVGAVAGNVRVGNVHNLYTVWQSVEYTTSQNIDRRAYALMNTITVIPGAIGAWRKDAVEKAGGYQTDTLAEDMDLTWRIRKLGYQMETESEAIAYTEAPDSFKNLFKQRFRWAYGTLQCLWKHKNALFRFGLFGWFALPSLWIFQVVFNALAPFVDLQLAYSLYGFASKYADRELHSDEFQPLTDATQTLTYVLVLYAIFIAIEIVAGIIAYRMERRSAKDVLWLFLQRFVYRQLMYAVIYKSIVTAITGVRQGWGKFERKASVKIP